jgi:hypothetical protein
MSDSKISAIPFPPSSLPPLASIANTFLASGSNTGYRSIASKLGESLSVLDFIGVDPTGATDSTVGIRNGDAAATAAGVDLFYPPGTYLLAVPTGTSANAINRTGCTWRGAGRTVSILKAAAGVWGLGARMVRITGSSGTDTYDLGFDTSLPTIQAVSGGCYVFLAINCSNYVIKGCGFTGIQAGSDAIYANGGSNWDISGNYFNMPSPNIHHNQSIEIAPGSSQFNVHHNICIGTAIFSAAAYGSINDNLVYGWSFGGGITLNYASGARSHEVLNNMILSGGISTGYVPDVNSVYPDGIESFVDDTIISGNYVSGCAGDGIRSGGARNIISGNVSSNNSQGGAIAGAAGISVYNNNSPGHTGQNTIVCNNQIFDDQGTPTQQYGYVEYGTAPLTGVVAVNNTSTGNVLQNYNYLSTAVPGTSYQNGGIAVQQGQVIVAGSTAVPVVLFSTTSGFGIYFGSGAPSFTAAHGSLYIRSDGSSTSTRLYVNQTGSTTWTNFTSAA